MEIIRQQILLSNREKFEIIEIREGHRLKFFSYTYRMSDKQGNYRPIIRWDNFGGQIHYETYDSHQRLFNQQKCDYKNSKEILQLIKIFKHNLATMDLTNLV